MSCESEEVNAWWGFWERRENPHRHLYQAFLTPVRKYLPFTLSSWVTGQTNNQTLVAFNSEDTGKLEAAWQRKEQELVFTEGTRSKVNITKMERTLTYWMESPVSQVSRYIWFFEHNDEYQPFDEDSAVNLEQAYRQLVTNKVARAQVVLDVSKNCYLKLDHSTGTLTLYEDNVVINVTRGCPREKWDTPESNPGEIKHVIFVCHGIGTVADLTLRSMPEILQEDVKANTEKLLKLHFSEETPALEGIEYIPICWHKALYSDDLKKDYNDIDLNRIVKKMLRITVLDIALYHFPYNCEVILSTVARQMNTMYNRLVKLNPNFKGTISLIGHSFGGVILFDLLSRQSSSSDTDEVYQEVFEAITKDIEVPEDQLEILRGMKADRCVLLNCGEEYLSLLGLRPEVSQKINKRLKNFREDYFSWKGDPMSESTMQHLADFRTIPDGIFSKLSFKPDCFFSLGSAIALVLRGRRLRKINPHFRLPTCPVFANIFHPRDPLAYRLETLFDPNIGEAIQLPASAKDYDDKFEARIHESPNGDRRIDYVLPRNFGIMSYLFFYPILESHCCYWNSSETFLFILKTIHTQCKQSEIQNMEIEN